MMNRGRSQLGKRAFLAGRAWACLMMPMLMALVVTAALAFPSQASEDELKSIARNPKYRAKPEDVGKGDLYALVVGIAKYQDPGIRQLKVSDNDAKEFAQFLESQRRVFKNLHIKLLLNEDATRENIQGFLFDEIPKSGKDDSVIVFLSGHGAKDPKKPQDYYFLGYDAKARSIPATSVKMNGLDFLKGLESKRILVVADSCHAGGYTDVPGTKSLDNSVLDRLARDLGESEGKVILSSSRHDQESREKPGMPNSVFTYYLLKGLRGEADSSRDGIVTAHEAYQYAYDRTKDETEGAQHPQWKGAVEGSFPVSLAMPPPKPIQLEVSFIAQDPRCRDPKCIDPQPGDAECFDPLCGDVQMKDGDTMFAGQNFQIAVRPAETCYLYVYHLGVGGDLHRLFPGKDYMSPGTPVENPVKGDEIFWIPAKDKWLIQDQQVGKEKIYVVASRSQNLVLEDLQYHLEQLEKSRDQVQSAANTRKTKDYLDGLIMAPLRQTAQKAVVRAGSAPPDRKTRSFEQIAAVLDVPGLDAVRSVWFWLKPR
ncbi:MAG: caspase family protein [Thermodesulfobacteriota bacterium]